MITIEFIFFLRKAAILKLNKADNKLELICSGVLIDDNIVLIPANCVHEKEQEAPINMSDLKIRLNFGNEDEVRGDINVVSFRIHENWDPKSRKYKNNIALILLKEKVELSKSIQPICLPTNDKLNIQEGFTIITNFTKKNEKFQFQSKLIYSNKAETAVDCARSSGLVHILERDMFCIHRENESSYESVGAVFTMKYKGRYFIIGLGARLDRYNINKRKSIFTDISKHVNFIDKASKELKLLLNECGTSPYSPKGNRSIRANDFPW